MSGHGLSDLDFTVGKDEPDYALRAAVLEFVRDGMARLDKPETEIRSLLAAVNQDFRDAWLHRDHARAAVDEAFLGLNGLAVREPTWLLWPQFRVTTETETRWIVRDLIPASGLSVIGSTPKAGKTWHELHLATCCVTAKPFLGRFVVPAPIGVHYLALEGSRSALRTRIGALARGLGIDPDGHELDRLVIDYKPRGANLSDPVYAAWYCEQVLASGAVLAIIDTARRGARIRESWEGVQDLELVRANLAPLLDAGVAVRFLHHARKLRAGGEWAPPLERLAGSGDWGGVVEVGFVLDRTKGGTWRTAKLEIEGRDIPEYPPLTVLYRLDGESDEAPDTTRSIRYEDALHVRCLEASEAADELAPKIVAWMRGRGPLAPWEIKEKAQVDGRAWSELVNSILKLGVVSNGRKTTAARYEIPEIGGLDVDA